MGFPSDSREEAGAICIWGTESRGHHSAAPRFHLTCPQGHDPCAFPPHPLGTPLSPLSQSVLTSFIQNTQSHLFCFSFLKMLYAENFKHMQKSTQDNRAPRLPITQLPVRTRGRPCLMGTHLPLFPPSCAILKPSQTSHFSLWL